MRLELTRRGDYAVRAMLALSAPDVEPWLSASRISGAMTIPERFLPRVLRDLARAGLVEARTGRAGGYRLARAARRITIPTLLVRGRMSDLLSEEGAQELLELVPHAQLADVAGAGHMVAGDRNDAFNDAVVTFLAAVRDDGAVR